MSSVIRETTIAIVQYPMLTGSNYNEWALLMRVNLQARKGYGTLSSQRKEK